MLPIQGKVFPELVPPDFNLFFLNENGAYLSPATVMEVDENGVVIPPWSMKIDISYAIHIG